MKRLLILAAVLPTLAVTGCQSLTDSHAQTSARDFQITRIVGQVWKIDAVRADSVSDLKLSEALGERASRHCGSSKMAMLPLRGAVVAGPAGQKHGWLEFRCQRDLNYRPEYKGITGFFKIDELAD